MLRCFTSSSLLRNTRQPLSILPVTQSRSAYYLNYKARRYIKWKMEVQYREEEKKLKKERWGHRQQEKHQQEGLEGGGGQAHQSDPVKKSHSGPAKLRGLPKDPEVVRVSKTLSWILRHASQKEGVLMRPDGYVRVDDLLKNPRLSTLDFLTLEKIVKEDNKTRFSLLSEPDRNSGSTADVWWIRANQGHSMKEVELDLQPISSAVDIPTRMAIHGTTRQGWKHIRKEGLSKMKRNHIHLAQGVPGSGVISGMRKSSEILIYIDVQKAIDAGIKFYISANGVVLTEGDDSGYLSPEYFDRVEDKDGKPISLSRPSSPVGKPRKERGPFLPLYSPKRTSGQESAGGASAPTTSRGEVPAEHGESEAKQSPEEVRSKTESIVI